MTAEKIAFLVISMIVCHIIDDFVLQGILAKMKQESWWKNQPEYTDLYKYDYQIALLAHAFEWSYVMMIPVFILFKWDPPIWIIAQFLINVITHSIIDTLKCNSKVINLRTDQMLHILQIIATAIMTIITY